MEFFSDRTRKLLVGTSVLSKIRVYTYNFVMKSANYCNSKVANMQFVA